MKVEKLTLKQEIDLIKRAKESNAFAIEEFYLKYKPYVYGVAEEYMNRGLEFEDIVSEGKIGLFLALERFDVTKKAKFSTYATYWIRERILLLFKNNGRKDVAVPYNKLITMQKIKKIESQLADSNLSEEEKSEFICRKLKIDKKLLNELKLLMQPVLYLDTAIYEVDNYKVEEAVENKIISSYVRSALQCLSKEEQVIVKMLYFDRRSKKEIKEITNFEYGRINKNIRNAHKKMREYLELNGISGDML